MSDKLYMQYDLIEVGGNRRRTCWLSSIELKVGDRITLKDFTTERDPETDELRTIWWQIDKKYFGVSMTKEEVEVNNNINLH